MAKFDVGRGFFANFDTTPIATADGTLIERNAHLIRFSVDRVPNGFESFIGDFTFTDEGQPVGTATEVRFDTGDTQIYRISDADINTLELLRIAGEDDPQAFLRYIFRADDRFVGAGRADLMRGYAGNDTLIGRGGDDALFGGPGRDKLRGGCGDDWLDGGRGRNVLVGGKGDDSFIFRDDCRADLVKDFPGGRPDRARVCRARPSGSARLRRLPLRRHGGDARAAHPLRRRHRLAALCSRWIGDPARATHRSSCRRAPPPRRRRRLRALGTSHLGHVGS